MSRMFALSGMRTITSLSAVLLAGLVGCSSHKTVSVGDTTVTSDDGNKSMTVTTKEGTTTIGRNAVDVAKLGVPVYPGAVPGEGGFSFAAGNGNTQMVTLTTGDAFDKVADWYKNRLGKDSEQMRVSNENSSVAEYTIGAAGKGAPSAAITITGKKDKTDIMIVKGTK
jgi:hypothetical protein